MQVEMPGVMCRARAEALRARDEEAGAEQARARVLAARAALKLDGGNVQARRELAAVWLDEGAPDGVRCRAAGALGIAEAAGGDRAAAFSALRFAYLNAREPELFWQAGCSLYLLMKADKHLRRAEPGLWQSLQSCRDAWPPEIWRECRAATQPAGTSWGSLPGKWIVGFYRSQIGPAIGSRCDLQPSCSEYFLRASKAHGLLGLPIMADRFIREPSVVAAKEKPVVMPDGHVRFADPLSDHDGWWTEGRE